MPPLDFLPVPFFLIKLSHSLIASELLSKRPVQVYPYSNATVRDPHSGAFAKNIGD
jgi:hypothetical protein